MLYRNNDLIRARLLRSPRVQPFSGLDINYTLELPACGFFLRIARTKNYSLHTGIFSLFLLFFFFLSFFSFTMTETLKLQMSWQRVFLAVGLFGVLLLLTNADNSVHILSKYQLITSTTLNWLPRTHYDHLKEIVIGGFEIEKSEGMSN